MSGKDTNRRPARVRHTVAVREVPAVRPPESPSLLVILNGAKRREGSGLGTRSLFRAPDPIRPRLRACSSAAPQDDSGDRLGFTLIELLVVISVVVLLMALLLAALGRARKQARAVVCRAHLRQWGTVLALYLEEHDGRFARISEEQSGLSLLRGLYISDKVDPNEGRRYHAVRTEGIACCPMASRGNGRGTFRSTANGVVYLEGILGLTFAPWEIIRPAPAFRMSYGLNSRIHSRMFDGPGSRGPHLPYTDVFALRGRDNIPLLFDAVGPGNALVFERQPPPRREPSGAAGQTCINRHDGTINGLFLDWSVRPIGLKELWTLKWHLQWDTAGPWTKAGGVQPADWPQWMRRFKDY